MITGIEQVQMPVFTGMAPKDNQPLVVPRRYLLLAGVQHQDDFTVGQMDQILPPIQSVFLDNSANGSPLSIYIPVIDYSVVVGSFSQAVLPIYSPTPFTPRLTLAVDGAVTALWCNFLQPYAQWVAT